MRESTQTNIVGNCCSFRSGGNAGDASQGESGSDARPDGRRMGDSD